MYSSLFSHYDVTPLLPQDPSTNSLERPTETQALPHSEKAFAAFIDFLNTHWNETHDCQVSVQMTGIPLQTPVLCQTPSFDAIVFQTTLMNHVPQKTISALLAQFPHKLMLFHYEDGLIDGCFESPIDHQPILALDICWQNDEHFKALNRVRSPLELLLRLQCFFGKQKLRRKFVHQFRQCLKKIALAWEGLTTEEPETRHALAFDTLLRLIFLAFLESRGLLDGRRNFILEEADKVRAQGANVFEEFLRPFYFGTLNVPPKKRAPRAAAFGKIPFLNGGLFQPTAVERHHPGRTLPNDVLWNCLLLLLEGWEFSDHETRHHDAALDPMMLGHVFESLMPHEFRTHTGSYYTPMNLVRDIVGRALCAWATFELDISMKHASDLFHLGIIHEMTAEKAEQHLQRIRRIRIIDIASGSGAFLQAAFEFLHRVITALMRHSGHTPHAPSLAREILLHNLYGVDILESANRICELRLWLATLKFYQPDEELPPLPNLDMNIRCGHSLLELSQYAMTLGCFPVNENQDPKVAALRKQYGIATGRTKQRLASRIEAIDRQMEENLRSRLCSQMETQLQQLRRQAQTPDLFGNICPAPNMREQIRQLQAHLDTLKTQPLSGTFSFDVHFGHMMAEGGFDILLGNPPWFGLHTRPAEERMTLRRLFQVAQTPQDPHHKCHQSMDMSALFVEKSLSLARPGGIVAMLVPSKLFQAPSYEAFRKHIATHAQCLFANDWTATDKNAFDAVTFPADIVLRKIDPMTRKHDAWYSKADVCRINISTPEPIQRALSCVPQTIGSLFTIKQGIKTAANDLFVCTLLERNERTSVVRFKDAPSMEIETELLYPILRGSDISAYTIHPCRHLVLTHDRHNPGRPLAVLPPLAKNWFDQHRARLQGRRSVRHSSYALSGVSDQIFSKKVVWRDISEELSACYVGEKTILPLNTAYYIAVPNEETGLLLAAWFNSTPIRKLCRARAEHAKNGYRRYFAWLIRDIPWPFRRIQDGDPMAAQIIDVSKKAHESIDQAFFSPKRQNRLDQLVLKAILRQDGGMS